MQTWAMISSMNSLSVENAMVQDQQTLCIISKELVDSAFKYQKVIMESTQKKIKNMEIAEEIESTKSRINTLKQEKKKLQELFDQKKDIKKTKNRIMEANRKKLKELYDLQFAVVKYNSSRQSIPDSIMFRCMQEISAGDQLERQ